MKFNDFALRPEILQAVTDAGYEIPTPIQQQAIPIMLTGSDLLGIAQTGTGKTAAFVLPMIERLASGRAKARMPRSLILSPTRELATQTANYFATYGKHLNLSMALLIGGVGMDEQWRLLERGVDVLIATPGRLLDQFERGKVLLGGVTILVIDEADRMLDMGFIPDVERIVGLVSRNRQTLMFSATMPPEIRRLADAFLTDPKEVQATPPATTADGVEDHVTVVPRARQVPGAAAADRDPGSRQGAHLLQSQARGRQPAPAAGAGRPQCPRHPRRFGAVAADPGARCLQARRDRFPGRDRRRGARSRHRKPAVRDQLRRADPCRRLRASHRAHRQGRPGGPRLHSDPARGAPLRRRDHQAHRQGHPAARHSRPGGGCRRQAGNLRASDAARTARRQRLGAERRGTAPVSDRAHRRQPRRCRESARPPNPKPELPALNGGRIQRPSSRPAPAEPDPTKRAHATPRPAPRAARAERPAPPRPARAATPVVGMGDHVPLFMRRAVPNAELLPKLPDD